MGYYDTDSSVCYSILCVQGVSEVDLGVKMNRQSREKSDRINASILIPVYDDAAGLKTTLQSLVDAGIQKCNDTEIIVCNDGGGEAISSVARSYGVIEFKLEKNQGSYTARNKGVENAKGDILVFLDADQRVEEGWLEEGIKMLEHSDYAGGRVIVETGSDPSVWEMFDAINSFPVKYYLDKNHFAPTANLFVRRNVFDRVGTFNERLQSGGDMEFGRRVFDAGLKQTYAPKAITFHPARNRTQQAIKIKRVAEGHADILCLVLGKSPIFVLINKLLVLCKVPVETCYRLISYPFLSKGKKEIPEPVFILMEKKRKFSFYYHIVKRTIHWL